MSLSVIINIMPEADDAEAKTAKNNVSVQISCSTINISQWQALSSIVSKEMSTYSSRKEGEAGKETATGKRGVEDTMRAFFDWTVGQIYF